MSKPVLTLSTKTAPPATVVIDGEPYELVAPHMFAISSFVRLRNIQPKLDVLWNAASLTPEQVQELDALFGEICVLVLKAPLEVLVKLTDAQRVAVYQHFLQLRLPEFMTTTLAAAAPVTPRPKRRN